MRRWLVCVFVLVEMANPGHSQALPGQVFDQVKLSSTTGGAVGPLADGDAFGSSIAAVGDIDQDGVPDLAVGAVDRGPGHEGAVFICFLSPSGEVRSCKEIANGVGGFPGLLAPGDAFGVAIAPLGDIDGDGVPDIIVGASGDDDTASTGANQGAVWLLFLLASGDVKHRVKLSAGAPWIDALLDPADAFGTALANLGDIDGDGLPEVAIGVPRDDDGGTDRGAIWIFSLDGAGSVVWEQKISAGTGGLPPSALADQGLFGTAVTLAGDLDGDGLVSIGVGAPVSKRVLVLELDSAGEVQGSHVLEAGQGALAGQVSSGDAFGTSLASLPDLDGSGVSDLAVGSFVDNAHTGAVWNVLLKADGSASGVEVVSSIVGDPAGGLAPGDRFGYSLCSLGDCDDDGRPELAVGAIGDDDGGPDRGSCWLISLRATRWQNLGQGIPGSNGVPTLSGSGPLTPGSVISLALVHARPFAPVTLVAGIELLNAPFKGGVMVPSPALMLGFSTDGLGSMALAAPWPSGVPSRFTIYLQAWIVDAAAPKGLASSNGLAGTTP